MNCANAPRYPREIKQKKILQNIACIIPLLLLSLICYGFPSFEDLDEPRDISPFGIFPESGGQETARRYPDIPKPPRKSRRKKSKNNSPRASSRSRSRSSSSSTADSFGVKDMQAEI